MCYLCGCIHDHSDVINMVPAYQGAGTSAGTVSNTQQDASLRTMADFLTMGYWGIDAPEGFDTRTSNVITVNLNGLNADGKQLARWAMESWEMVADLSFQEISTSADITFHDDEGGAYASIDTIFTGGQWFASSADVYVPASWTANDGVGFGGYAYSTYIHELGHALGLGHLGPYNGSSNFATDAIFANDSQQVSVMSYFGQNENPNVDATYADPITPMMADILAIQDIYGAPGASSATAGDTVWGRDNDLGGNFLDTFLNSTYPGSPTEDLYLALSSYTIYDRDGIDTWDWSDSVQNNYFSMVPGTFSDLYGAVGTVGIAEGTIIENAIFSGGNDTIIGNWANNYIEGRAGADRIEGGAGFDTVYGGPGADRIEGGNGGDLLGGSTGNDTMTGGVGNDTLWGASGNDRLEGGSDNDILGAAGGNDWLQGDDGNDELWTSLGNDTAVGGDGNDTLGGAAGNDSLMGGAGNDELWGADGVDTLFGGADNDSLGGGALNDRLDGGAGDDLVSGGLGNDTVLGGSGDDTLFGSTGNDRLEGGAGDDEIWGGAGNDRFVFNVGDGNDRIRSSSLSEDRLVLDASLWGGGLTAAQVVSTYGSVSGADAVLDFGTAGSITLEDLGANLSTLHTMIEIF